jgi:hypothetical protein
MALMSTTHWDITELTEAARTDDPLPIAVVQRHFGQEKDDRSRALFAFAMGVAADAVTDDQLADLKRAFKPPRSA